MITPYAIHRVPDFWLLDRVVLFGCSDDFVIRDQLSPHHTHVTRKRVETGQRSDFFLELSVRRHLSYSSNFPVKAPWEARCRLEVLISRLVTPVHTLVSNHNVLSALADQREPLGNARLQSLLLRHIIAPNVTPMPT